MKRFRSVFVLVLALSMLLGLCACGGSGTDEKTTEAPVVTTEAPEETTEAPTEAKDVYRVKVMDESGNPIAGAMVQMCLETCFPGVTNAEGVAEFDLKEADYKVTFMSLPAGYTYSTDEQEFHFADGTKELTITLKKAE